MDDLDDWKKQRQATMDMFGCSPPAQSKPALVPSIQLTADEIATVAALIEDWGFEYSLRADRDKVAALAIRLGVYGEPPARGQHD